MGRVRLSGGAGISPRANTVYNGFTAKFNGTCRGCGMAYKEGDRIKSPGKGMGAYHLQCKMPEAWRVRPG